MHGVETYNLMFNNYPQDKIYSFYKCLNNDYSKWNAFFDLPGNTTFNTLNTEYLDEENKTPGIFSLCQKDYTYYYQD